MQRPNKGLIHLAEYIVRDKNSEKGSHLEGRRWEYYRYLEWWLDSWLLNEKNYKSKREEYFDKSFWANWSFHKPVGEQLVRQISLLVDVQRILAIPLAIYQMDDFVAWSLARSGCFSVKSVYHVDLEP